MKNLLLMLWLTLLTTYSLQSQMTIFNTQTGEYILGSGDIDDITFSLRPKGIYTEVSIYLSYTSTLYSNPSDSLVMEHVFTLPPHSVITDSWLWEGDEIIQAEIWDIWTPDTANGTFLNGAINHSILTQKNLTSYSLKIFPLFKGSSRKAKITYLVPNIHSENHFKTLLPTDILCQFLCPEKVKIIFWPNNDWSNPAINHTLGSYPFTPMMHPTLGAYLSTEILNIDFANHATPLFSVSKSIPTPTAFLGKYTTGNENYYQLSISPSILFDSIERNKVAILVDFEENNVFNPAFYSKQDILDKVKLTIKEQLLPQDSFNLILSGTNPYTYSNVWLAADSANIESAFLNAANNLSNYSNIDTLLSTGIQFINNNTFGKILIISSSQAFHYTPLANTKISKYLSQMQTIIPIYIADYQDKNFYTSSVSNQTYYGNEYFYIQLSSLTGGKLFQMFSKGVYKMPFVETINNCLLESYGVFTSLNISTSMENDSCFDRYTLSTPPSPNRKTHIYQVGKYNGNFPFHISLSGEYKGNVYNKEIVIPAAEVLEGDSTLKQVWVGANMRDLYTYPQTNTLINQIIDVSLENRVLSYYTAFICLEEPEWVCETCVDETTDIDSLTHEETFITAYPNPFENEITIKIAHPSTLSIEDTQMAIYDISGAVVKTFTADEVTENSNNEWQINWRSSDEIASGMYFFKVKSNTFHKTTKLIKR